jgi:gas vesicle protein GvpL/GvpF
MPLLLYCITETGFADFGSGVAGLPVTSRDHAGLCALFSNAASAEFCTTAPLSQSAKQFHDVVQRVFKRSAVIPFRFPTVMKDEEELTTHLHERAAEYADQLRKFGSFAQMELVIARPERPDKRRTPSGTDYLKERQLQLEQFEHLAKDVQFRASGLVNEWRTRNTNQALRLFGLVARDAVSAFRAKLQGLSVPAGCTVRVLGPWPVTEFLELNQS